MRPDDRQPRPQRRRRRTWRIVIVAIGAVALVLAAGRVAATPLMESRLRRALQQLHGMRGTFDHLDLSVLRLAFAIHDLRIVKLSPEGARVPYVQVRRAELGLYWKELMRGHLVGAVRVEHPKLSLISSDEPARKQEVEEAPQLGEKLQQLAPFRLDRFEIRDGEILWIDAKVPERPELWLQGIEATLENFATRAALARGEPSVLAASATLQRSGQVSLFASADPAAKAMTFAGEAEVRGLRLVELGSVLSATQDVTPTQGTIDLAARFKCVDGRLTGAVRPIIKHPGVREAKPGLGPKLKALVADVTLDILSDRVPSRDAVATTIPLRGDVTRPNAEVWPTIIGVVRNAFVAGLSESLRAVPAGSGERGGAARRGPESRRPHRRAGDPGGR